MISLLLPLHVELDPAPLTFYTPIPVQIVSEGQVLGQPHERDQGVPRDQESSRPWLEALTFSGSSFKAASFDGVLTTERRSGSTFCQAELFTFYRLGFKHFSIGYFQVPERRKILFGFCFRPLCQESIVNSLVCGRSAWQKAEWEQMGNRKGRRALGWVQTSKVGPS